jgi:Fe-S cluster assembly iron-binding protein IscA
MTHDQNSHTPSPPVTVSESAATALKAAVDASAPASGEAVIRIALVEKDSALAHQVTLESAPVPNDVVFEQYGLTMVVAPEDVEGLAGAHFDLQTDGGQPRLIVSNPNLP